jgi:hypothetical protein
MMQMFHRKGVSKMNRRILKNGILTLVLGTSAALFGSQATVAQSCGYTCQDCWLYYYGLWIHCVEGGGGASCDAIVQEADRICPYV